MGSSADAGAEEAGPEDIVVAVALEASDGPGQVAEIEAGGAYVVDDELATDDRGRAVKAGPGDVVLALALEASSGPGDVTWIATV